MPFPFAPPVLRFALTVAAETVMDKPPPLKTIDKLIFVYNADGGLVQGLLDTIHKTLSPSTYACSLCAITYGAVRIDPKWRAWLKTLPMPAVFLHKDEIARELPGLESPLPVVLASRGERREVLLDAARLKTLRDVDALIAALRPLVTA